MMKDLENRNSCRVELRVAKLKREGAGEEEIITTSKYIKGGHKGQEKDLLFLFILGRTGANELSVQQSDSVQM